MTGDIPLGWFLASAAACFSVGLFGLMARRNAIAVLMAIEIMLNAANLNLVAFWRYLPISAADGPANGPMMALFVVAIAAAEVAVGIGLILACYRRWKVADVDQYDTLSG